ncbi:TonB-dependent receptor [Lysobacter capsici]|uniref:TonB-dependent receptor plug domain-containing protein n=1 Tax=Lysobacter capsici TaxID=435897 RepID=UPI00071655A5|nr:TonB-dependent receptor [Lysobacter capsici]ALN84518.1 tonB dependent receptor family protein [Lysobacter capsici]UOF16093.1 TonB-dependent receptor [Lysobacter capsici]
MILKTNQLRDAITFALAVSSTALVGTGAAFAQETGSKEATTLDRVEVTGSRIRQVDVETAAPVLQISRAEIEKQGYKSVADILQNITAAGSPAISRTSPLSSGESVGGYYIDLRNLGANRTLVLVNGKRLGATNDGLQDVSSIPSGMVERIEVLKDGASTIYGSDAIAGVINIITRKNFEGAEANAYIGQWGQGDGTRQSYDFTIGFTGDRGSVTVGAEYSKEDPVWARDRWFSQAGAPTGPKSEPRDFVFSGTTQWGALLAPVGRNAAGNPVDAWTGLRATGPTNPASGLPVSAPRFLARENAGLDLRDSRNFRARNGSDVSLPSSQSTVYSGIERKSLFVNAGYDITDWLRFDTDIQYNDRDSFAQNAGYPFQSAVLAPGFNTPLSIDSYYNPLGNQRTGPLPPFLTAPTAVHFVRRGWEVPRQVRNSLTTYRFTGAFSGSFELGEGKIWDWDAGYLLNENKATQISTGNLNVANVRRAVGPSFLNAQGQVQCGTQANPIALGVGGGQCTPWNPLLPFGYAGANGLNDPNVQKYLYQNGQAVGKTKTTDYFVNFSGTLATLPAGDLSLAVGYEHRKEQGNFSPDALSQTGGSTDLASGPTGGSYSLDEFYGELQIPILADMTGAKELTVNLATRYSDYDTFGDTVNSKFGVKWKPIDSLLVRATYAEGFRAPTISDLYGGLSQSFSFYTDPCDTLFGNSGGSAACVGNSDPRLRVPANFRQPANTATGLAPRPSTQTGTPFLSGSNDQLVPETSTSKTFGIVWSPGFVENLNLSLDWWNIKIENAITGDSPSQVLADCYTRGITSRCNVEQDPSRSRFTRDPVTGGVNSFIFAPINVGYNEVEGFDFDVNYRIDTQWGRFGLAWLSSYTVKNELQTDVLGEAVPSQQNGFGGFFRLRSNLNLSWDKGPWGFTWGMRYYSGVKENCSFDDRCSLPDYTAPEFNGANTPMNEIGSNTFHDMQVRFNAPWNATIAVGANNVFEHYSAPNYDNPNSGYAYYGGYDIGRFIYFKYQQRF